MSPGSLTRLTDSTGGEVLDVLGPTVEFLTGSPDQSGPLCLMRGVVPPGVTVPLHSHDDVEAFYIVSGSHEVLLPGDDGLRWLKARAGDFVHVAGGDLHAHRNVGDEVAVDLIITTPRMGQFFREIGVPVQDVGRHSPQQRMSHFVEIALRYGMRLGTPEENAAVGIDLPAV